MRSKRRGISQRACAETFADLGIDQDGFEKKFVSMDTGYGLFACKEFQKGDFLLEYRGIRTDSDKADDRTDENYVFYYKQNGKEYRIDASSESSCLARWVNDEHVRPNSSMKKIVIGGTVHICLFAIQTISPGTELRYDYGQSDLPWRKKRPMSPTKNVKRDNCGSIKESYTSSDNDKCDSATASSNTIPVTEVNQRMAGSSADSSVNLSFDKIENEIQLLAQLVEERIDNFPNDDAETESLSSAEEQVVVGHVSQKRAGSEADITSTVNERDEVSSGDWDNDEIMRYSESNDDAETESLSSAEEQFVVGHVSQKRAGGREDAIVSSGDCDNDEIMRYSESNDDAETESLSSAEEQFVVGHVSQKRAGGREDAIVSSGDCDNDEIMRYSESNDDAETESLSSAEEQFVVGHVSQKRAGGREDAIVSSADCDNDEIMRYSESNDDAETGSLSSAEEQFVVGHVSQKRAGGREDAIVSSGDCDNDEIMRYSESNDDAETESLSSAEEQFVVGHVSQRRAGGREDAIVSSGDCDNDEIMRYSESNDDAETESLSSAEEQFVVGHVSQRRAGGREDAIASAVDEKDKDLGSADCEEESSDAHGDNDSDKDYVPDSECSDDEDMSCAARIPRRLTQYQQISSSSNALHKSTEEDAEQTCGPSSTSGVRVLQTNNGEKRSWDKFAYCPFCETKQAKLPRHLKEVQEHQGEPEVLQWMATRDPVLKKQRLTKMRNYGNFLHNAKVKKENRGFIIPVYRPDYEADPDDYLPCPDCLGYYSKRDMWKHSCLLRSKDDQLPKKRGEYIRASLLLLPHAGVSKITNEVLASIRSGDEVGTFIRTDDLTKQLAEKLSLKLGHDKSQFPYIRTKLREVARLVLQFREDTGQYNASLKDVINPKKFLAVIKATQKIAGFNDQTHLYSTPSLALKVGHTLHKAAEILRGEALMEHDNELEARSKGFIKLYHIKWEELVSNHALRTLKENKRNGTKYLPLTDDVCKLSKHLKLKVAEGRRQLESLDSTDSEDMTQVWKDLAKATLASLVVFNRKRSGEVSKMKASDLLKCSKGDTGLMTGGLTKLEERLCSVLWRTEIVGKKTRTVPVLMTSELKETLDLLQQTKGQAGVPLDNEYIFAMPNSDSHLRGSDIIREFANSCGAKYPSNLTSTSLRKHIATLSQIMNLKDNELDVLANFLGHDVRTHREYYRLPEGTVQLAKVSKVLLSIENGDITNIAGKSLDDIELDPDEVVPTEEPMEDSTEEPTEEPTEESTVEPTEESTEEPTEESTEEPTEESIPKPSEKPKPNNGRKKTQDKRRPWTPQERRVVQIKFGSFIIQNKLPGKRDIQQVLDSEPALRTRKWTNIKDHIRNEMKRNAHS